MSNAKNILKVKLYEKQNGSIPKIEDLWCEQQVNDFDHVISLLDNVICAAICSNMSAQHYTMLEEAKTSFVEGFINTCEKYRIVRYQ